MPDSDARPLRSLPDLRCECPILPNPREANRVRTLDATGQGCSWCGLPLPSTERPRHVRLACRYRLATNVVPDGHLVHHPRCPLCGERLAYRADGDRARYLHVDDPLYRVTAVP